MAPYFSSHPSEVKSKVIEVKSSRRGGGGVLPYKRLMRMRLAGWGRIFTTGLTIMGSHFQ